MEEFGIEYSDTFLGFSDLRLTAGLAAAVHPGSLPPALRHAVLGRAPGQGESRRHEGRGVLQEDLSEDGRSVQVQVREFTILMAS